MTGLSFLLVALALSVVGSLLLWLRHRKPTSIDHGIREFSREMQALAPNRHERPPGEAGGVPRP